MRVDSRVRLKKILHHQNQYHHHEHQEEVRRNPSVILSEKKKSNPDPPDPAINLFAGLYFKQTMADMDDGSLSSYDQRDRYQDTAINHHH